MSSSTSYEQTPGRVALGCVSIAISCICAIISIHYQLRFLRLRQHPFIAKRHPYLASIFSFGWICMMLFERTLSVLQRTGINNAVWFEQLRWIFFCTFLHSSMFAMLLRVYLVFYDVQWTKANDMYAWKYYIHHKPDDEQKKSVFVKYHTTLGSAIWISKWFIVASVLMICIPIIVLVVTKDFFVSSLVDAILLTLQIVLIALFWFNTPMFHDEFSIRAEIRKSVICGGLVVCHYTAFVVTGLMGRETFISWYITHVITVAFFFVFTMISGYWPVWKYNQIRQKQQDDEYYQDESGGMQCADRPKSDDVGTLDPMERDRSHSAEHLYIRLGIVDIIKEEMGFHAFMKWLAKEFSMENLLAIVEMSQYKQRFLQFSTWEEADNEQDTIGSLQTVANKVAMKIVSALPIASSKSTASDSAEQATVDVVHTVPLTELLEQKDEDLQEEKVQQPLDIGTSAKLHAPVSDISIKAEEARVHDLKDLEEGETSPRIEYKRGRSLIDVRSDIIELPENLPKSTIVYGDYGAKFDEEKDRERVQTLDKTEECKRIVKALYEKYIIVGCDLEVNLAHRLRQKCMKKYHRIDELYDDALLHVFDKCLEMLLKLMEDSYTRFRGTPGFRKYEEKMQKKIADNLR